MRILPFLLLLSLNLFGIEAPTSTAPLSVAGKNRLSQNLTTLEQNLKAATANAETTKRNIETLQQEVRELEGLETEYQTLNKRYQDHVALIQKELEKNAQALTDLEKYLSKSAPPKGSGREPSAAEDNSRKAQSEKTERTKWKEETEEKLKQIQNLQSSTTESIKKIHARKMPISNQIETESRKESEYNKMVREILVKKTEVQKLLSAQ